MGHARKHALKGLGLIALALAAQSRDPADVLRAARDRLLDSRESLQRISCTETIDRSYFRRATTPERAPSCDQIAADRKRGRYKLTLYATDRMRLRAYFSNGREVFGWREPSPFDRPLEDVLLKGPIATGALGGFYLQLFEEPESRFAYLAEKEGKLQYSFRQAEQASHHTVRAGEQWVAAAESGTFWIDAASADLAKFSVETSTLAPDTAMCETSAEVEYQRQPVGGEQVLLPRKVEWRDVMIDTQETVSVANYSSCTAEPAPRVEHAASAAGFAEKSPVVLALDDSIDSATAAAGDLVSAHVSRDVIERGSGRVLLRGGTRVRGRILNLEHWVGQYFVVAIGFDFAEVDGAPLPLHLRVDPVRVKDSSRWPEDSLVFETRGELYVVPRGYESKWLTVK